MKIDVESKTSRQIDVSLLLAREEWNPHAILGLHQLGNGQKVIRIFRPGASSLHIELFGKVVEVKPSADFGQHGIFELFVEEHATPLDYRIYHQNSLLSFDPYAFAVSVTPFDTYLYNKGVHYEVYKLLGAQPLSFQGAYGTRFAVWAPAARSVSLVGDFNYWDGRLNPMRSVGNSGIWELFVPGIAEGEKYKFEIKTQTKEILIKSDPYARSAEVRPATASIVASSDRFRWQDAEWMSQRSQRHVLESPLNIYEVHLGSWKKRDGAFLNYRELAVELADYCKKMYFTHVELMPVQEHPLDESWGYQVSGFYAPTSRYGTPEDFQWFVNHLHLNGIGVIIDWVPGHFPTDAFALGRFDGTALYEHAHEHQGLHPHWGTYIFNFDRNEVSNFLIANALFWCREMHADGLRVDGVASMLYLDYGREEGAWVPNAHGGKENLHAVEFLKHLNSILHEQFPDVLTIAEESTSYPGVTHPVDGGGLGFDYKWNMGWMNDTLRYFSHSPIYRSYHQNDVTFGLLYAFSERFVLPLSHDEVVHGKKSLISKMPGDMWQKFAHMRLLYGYKMCQPGKKLLFMGGEIGQWSEWNCKGEIDWGLLNFEAHKQLQAMVKDLNALYLSQEPLWKSDADSESFEWVDFSDRDNSVVSYLRKCGENKLFCLHNFTPNYHSHYVVTLRGAAQVEEIFNSDALRYGGSGKVNLEPLILKAECGTSRALEIQLPPLATAIFKIS